MNSMIQTRAAEAEELFKAGKYAHAVEIIRSMLEDSDPGLDLLLGKVYLNGWGVLRDKRTALEYLMKACEYDAAAAYREMSRIYSSKIYMLDGKDTICTNDQARWDKAKLLTYKAVRAGDVSALADLLESYCTSGPDKSGENTTRLEDAEKAAEKLAGAIFDMPDQKQLECCRPLINFCCRSKNAHFNQLENDIKGKILSMLREHGLKGDEWALDALTHKDTKLNINEYEAQAWLLYAAGMGFPKAEARLAKQSVQYGFRLPCQLKDCSAPVSAFLAMIDGEAGFGAVIEKYCKDTLVIWSWLVYAADNRNDADAAFRLGLMLMNGYGVPQDPLLARSMFLSAVRSSHPAANAELAYLEKILHSAEYPEKYRDYIPLHKTLEGTVKDWPMDEKREISADLSLLLTLIRKSYADSMKMLIGDCLEALGKDVYKTEYVAPVLKYPETGFMAKRKNEKRLQELEKIECIRVKEALSGFESVKPLYEKLQQALSLRSDELGQNISSFSAQLTAGERSLDGLLDLFNAGFGYGLCSLNEIRAQSERMNSLVRFERNNKLSEMNLYKDAATEWVRDIEALISEERSTNYDYSAGLARCSGPLFDKLYKNSKISGNNQFRLYYNRYYHYAECKDPNALYVLAGLTGEFPQRKTSLAALALGSQLQIDAIYVDVSQKYLLGLTSDQFEFYRSRVSESVRAAKELDRLKHEVFAMNAVHEELMNERSHRKAMAEAQAEKEAVERYRKNSMNLFAIQNYVDKNESLFNLFMNGAYETNEQRYEGGYRDFAQNMNDRIVRAAMIEEAKWKLDPNIL